MSELTIELALLIFQGDKTLLHWTLGTAACVTIFLQWSRVKRNVTPLH